MPTVDVYDTALAATTTVLECRSQKLKLLLQVADSSLSGTLARLLESLPIDFLNVGPPPSKAKAIEALNFMRGIMDECTALGNFGVGLASIQSAFNEQCFFFFRLVESAAV